MTRDHDAPSARRMLEYVVATTVTRDPAITRQSCDNLGTVRFELHRYLSIIRKYMRIKRRRQVGTRWLTARVGMGFSRGTDTHAVTDEGQA